MKKFLTIVCALFAGLQVSAQKFGHFDSNALIAELPEVKEVQKNMDAEASKIEATVTALNEDFQKMMNDYQQNGNTMAEADRAAKEQELQESYQKIQQYVQTSRQELAQKQQQQLAPIMQKILRIVQEVGVENDFLYIFEDKAGLAVHVGAKSVDITPLVKKKLGIQ